MASERTQDLCAYLKHLEDGPQYQSVWTPSFSERGLSGFWQTLLPTPYTAKAQFLDLPNPLENARAAVNRYMAYTGIEGPWEGYTHRFIPQD